MRPHFIHLVRHGESKGNIDSSLYKKVPDWKVPLTKKGKQQAACVGSTLTELVYCKKTFLKTVEALSKDFLRPPVIIYTSPMLRALQTAKIIRSSFASPKKIKLFEDPRLREQSWGNFKEDGQALKIEKERAKFGTFFYQIPSGESGAEVYDRLSTFLETLHRDFSEPNYPVSTIIVSHGLTIRCFLMRWLHWGVREFEQMKSPLNCEILTLELQDNDRYKLITPIRKRS